MVPGAGDGAGDEEARQRRTAPHERRLSSYSAFLLLLTIVQAAFGYAFLGPAAANAGLRHLHVAIGATLLALAFLFQRALAAHPERGARERLIAAVLRFYLGLAVFQALSGVIVGGYVPGIRLPLEGTHLGFGLLLPFLALLMHMAAVTPSLHLSARKEHAHALEDWRRLQASRAGPVRPATEQQDPDPEEVAHETDPGRTEAQEVAPGQGPPPRRDRSPGRRR